MKTIGLGVLPQLYGGLEKQANIERGGREMKYGQGSNRPLCVCVGPGKFKFLKRKFFKQGKTTEIMENNPCKLPPGLKYVSAGEKWRVSFSSERERERERERASE